MTTKIAVLGLGRMGLPMARNLLKTGHAVQGYDPLPAASEALQQAGGRALPTAVAALAGAEFVLTMLPAGPDVRAAYLGPDGILAHAAAGALLIDSSTIDVTTAREVAAAALVSGHGFLDAPVSGGVPGAEAGTLTFMVGGDEAQVNRARPVLEAMGRAVLQCGPAGAGQAAKLCNNLMLAIQMVSVAEGFVLAEALGLPAERLFAVASVSSGQCWSLTSYAPVPGLVPASPANRDYAPGFAASLMLKDLRLALQSAEAASLELPLAPAAAALYEMLQDTARRPTDFSAVITTIRGA